MIEDDLIQHLLLLCKIYTLAKDIGEDPPPPPDYYLYKYNQFCRLKLKDCHYRLHSTTYANISYYNIFVVKNTLLNCHLLAKNRSLCIIKGVFAKK